MRNVTGPKRTGPNWAELDQLSLSIEFIQVVEMREIKTTFVGKYRVRGVVKVIHWCSGFYPPKFESDIGRNFPLLGFGLRFPQFSTQVFNTILSFSLF